MRTPETRGNSALGFSPSLLGRMLNGFKRISRIISAGFLFGGSFVCDTALKHSAIKNAMSHNGRIVCRLTIDLEDVGKYWNRATSPDRINQRTPPVPYGPIEALALIVVKPRIAAPDRVPEGLEIGRRLRGAVELL